MNPRRARWRTPAIEISPPGHSAAATARHLGLYVVLLAMASPWAAAQQADPNCGNPFVNGFGPHDYRVEQGQNRKIVEDYHFKPQVESLISGQSSSLGGDIDYTLRAFPNHHRALISMMNLGFRLKVAKAPGANFTVECYFKRALLFRPDDTIARMIYAQYLAGAGRKADALPELEQTAQRAKDNGFTHYNLGLIYLEIGEFDKALLQAHRAQVHGFARPELKQRLLAAGKWSDPPPEGPESAASAAAPASEPSR